ncbi:MAG: hypothetical protein ABI333_28550 [bacterium]
MIGSQVMQLVHEIRRKRLSRNKHFGLFEHREYRAARRVKRYLDALAGEIVGLSNEGELDLELEWKDDDRAELHLGVQRLQLRRCCYLSRAELDYLLEHSPEVEERITRAGGLPARYSAPESNLE